MKCQLITLAMLGISLFSLSVISPSASAQNIQVPDKENNDSTATTKSTITPGQNLLFNGNISVFDKYDVYSLNTASTLKKFVFRFYRPSRVFYELYKDNNFNGRVDSVDKRILINDSFQEIPVVRGTSYLLQVKKIQTNSGDNILDQFMVGKLGTYQLIPS